MPDATAGTVPDPNQVAASVQQPPSTRDILWQDQYDEYRRQVAAANALDPKIAAAANNLRTLRQRYYELNNDPNYIRLQNIPREAKTPEQQRNLDGFNESIAETKRKYDNQYAEYMDLRDQYEAAIEQA